MATICSKTDRASLTIREGGPPGAPGDPVSSVHSFESLDLQCGSALQWKGPGPLLPYGFLKTI